MKQTRQTMDVPEALGIVIADGRQAEITPRFAAFVWGPAPEPMPLETTESKAA
jgi:hypothetical protein